MQYNQNLFPEEMKKRSQEQSRQSALNLHQKNRVAYETDILKAKPTLSMTDFKEADLTNYRKQIADYKKKATDIMGGNVPPQLKSPSSVLSM